MKSILIAGLVALSTPAFCQENANQKAIEHQKTLGYFGNFSHKIGENRSVNVNYSFAPLIPTTEVNFMLHTPTPRPLSFVITDASGKLVASYKPTENKYLEQGTLDVSALKAGKYEYKIYWDKELAYKIPFTKK